MENKKAFGHVLAIFTIFIWGTTFISTKILLQAFQPVAVSYTHLGRNRSRGRKSSDI